MLFTCDIVSILSFIFRLDAELGDEVEVPTLHVLYSTSEQNSVITRPYPTPDILQVREQLLDWIAEEALGGDREAAEWILLSTIARV